MTENELTDDEPFLDIEIELFEEEFEYLSRLAEARGLTVSALAEQLLKEFFNLDDEDFG